MRLAAGTRLGPYEILAPLGAGGMGEVYRARDTRLGRDVALKLLGCSDDPGSESDRRLRREAKTAAALNHPHICTIHEVAEAAGVAFIAMELIDGQSLQASIRRTPWPSERVCRVGRQLAEALEHAHARGVIHRDFKSANVMVTPDGQPKIVDFGIAVRTVPPGGQASTVSMLSSHDGIAGTVAYMAPEVLEGEEPTVRSDVWALGVVLYEMLSGRLPFEAASDSARVAAILRDAPAPLPAGTPPGLAQIVARCLAKDPAGRPARAGEVALALDVAASPPSTSAVSADRVSRAGRFTLARGGVAVAAVLLAGLLAWMWLRPPNDERPVRLANPTQVTTAVGVEEFPAWSPDGRTLAYAAHSSGNTHDSGNWDIWVAALGSGAPINRTVDYSGRDLFPSWSPDGSQIAFWSDRDGGGCYVMPALAGLARKIASASIYDPNPPQWSQNSSEIACITGDNVRARMDIVSLQTGHTLRGIDLPGDGRRMFVTRTRDERRLALVTSDGGLSADLTQLLVLDVATSNVFPITDGQTKVWGPNWSADGRTLYYVAPSGATMDLWQQRFDDDGKPQGGGQSLTAGVSMRNAALSSDGRRVAYSQGRKLANVWRVPLQPNRVVTWSEAQQVTFDQAFIECVDVNSAGTSLAVSSDRTGSFDLWTLPASGGEMSQLTSDPSAEWCPQWSPDGTTLAFFAHRTGNREVWIMPAVGGAWRQVTDEPGPDVHPMWSHDGRELAFTTRRPQGLGWWASGIGGEGGRFVAPFSPAKWSPVNSQLAFTDAGRMWVVDTNTPNARPEALPTGTAGPIRWTPDGKSLLYRSAQDSIRVVAADGKSPDRLLVNLSGRRGALGDHGTPTDGTWIYFTWNEDLGDLWAMDVLPPAR